jgi:hypothetical protein
VKKSIRLILLALMMIGVVGTVDANPAFAFFKHHHRHVVHKHTKAKKGKSKSSATVRDAQTSLINLKYLNGKADGVLGPKTVKAIKGFQRDNHLPVTGRLTRETYNAIIKADRTRAMASLPVSALPPSSPLGEVHQDTLLAQPGLVGPTNQQYADPLLGGLTVAGGKGEPQSVRTQELSSRYAKLDINENINGPTRRYNLTMNGTPLLQIDNQPSIIGISETFALEHEDVIVLTSFRDGDQVCAYKHFLLTLAEGRNELHPIGNCSHGYQARKVDDSVFITFPEVDDQRVAGATWRYEGGDLEKL